MGSPRRQVEGTPKESSRGGSIVRLSRHKFIRTIRRRTATYRKVKQSCKSRQWWPHASQLNSTSWSQQATHWSPRSTSGA
eukprot:scaffold9675_cov79-Cyclotella_meneghiniana.AAC.1